MPVHNGQVCRLTKFREALCEAKLQTRLGFDKFKPKVWFKYSLWIDLRNSAGLFHHVLFYMGDLNLVLPALNLSTLEAGILIMVQQVRMMMFSLKMVDYSMPFLLLST